jgi:hypothetical protein
MIYNAPTSNSHKISITGQGTVSMTPQTTGIYRGLSVFQDRTADVDVQISGNGNFNMTGGVYAANASVSVTGNGAVSVGSQYISRTLKLNGNGGLNITWKADQVPRQRLLAIVE